MLGEVKDENRFEFTEISEDYMRKRILELPRKASCGDDDIAYIDIIAGERYTVKLLTEITNMILVTRHWPRSWKNSILKPLYKGIGDRWKAGNYRPVALTSAISRLVERIVNEQLVTFIMESDLNLEENHGFVKGRGCATAVLEILQELSECVEDGGIPTMLGIDISAAFDCLNRRKLIRQLSHMGWELTP